MTVDQRPDEQLLSHRLLTVAMVVAIAIAFIGYFLGLRHAEHEPPPPAPAPTPDVAANQAPRYDELPTTRLGPNAAWTSRLETLGRVADEPGRLGVYDEAERRWVLGDREARRAYVGAPPVVPHAIDHGSDASCLACHEQGLRIGDRIATPVSHPPYENCTQCHVPAGNRGFDAAAAGPATDTAFAALASFGGGERPRADAPPTIPHATFMRENCATCHGELGGTGPATSHGLPLTRHMHEDEMQDQCVRCHVPTGLGEQAVPDRGEVSRVCLDCHQDVAVRMGAAATAHQPAVDDCTACHSMHAGRHERLLRQEVREGCLSCHQQVEDELRLGSYAHGAMIEDKSCAQCHDPHGSPMPRLLVDRMDRLCLSCHDSPKVAPDGRVIADMRGELSQPFLHGPVEAGDCSSCHRSHGTANAHLLRHPYPDRFYAEFDLDNYGLCFGCHSPDLVLVRQTDRLTGFRDGDVNLHYVHVQRDERGHTCRACHATHGSSQPMHLAEVVPFEGSDWPMPIGFEQDEDGGSCAPGCHDAKSYRRGAGLRLDAATSAQRGER